MSTSSSNPNLAQNVVESIDSMSSIPDPTNASLIADQRQAEIESIRQDTNQRKLYARQIFWMVCVWLFAIFILILFSGLKLFNFLLSDNILIALITTTTINVCAFFLAVTQYLFPSKKKVTNTNDSV